MPTLIDLGSGLQKVMGYISIDNNPRTDPDYLWSLERGLPKQTWSKVATNHGEEELPKNWKMNGSYKVFEDNSVDEIRAHHTLEHIRNLIPLMDEMWDALKPGGILKVYVPNAECPRAAWGDPTHVRAFSSISFTYFTRNGLAGHPYTDKAWKIIEGPEIHGTPPDDLWEIYCAMTPDK